MLTDVAGKYTPNIPRFKSTAVATYRHDEHWSGTLAARYSARVWATVDNTDINPNTYQGFDHYFVVDARHHDLLLRAQTEIENSIGLLEQKTSEEIVLVGLHNALRYLGEITGETTTEDMLTRIFSTFCIGK